MCRVVCDKLYSKLASRAPSSQPPPPPLSPGPRPQALLSVATVGPSYPACVALYLLRMCCPNVTGSNLAGSSCAAAAGRPGVARWLWDGTVRPVPAEARDQGPHELGPLAQLAVLLPGPGPRASRRPLLRAAPREGPPAPPWSSERRPAPGAPGSSWAAPPPARQRQARRRMLCCSAPRPGG
jgi:hypothetical protein